MKTIKFKCHETQEGEIIIGSHLFDDFENSLLIETLNSLNIEKFIIITDATISKLYLQTVLNFFSIISPVHFIVIDEKEESKTLQIVNYLCEHLTNLGLSKNSCLIALGGGVVGDITGFVASILFRGINFIQIPTSFLSQVDSSIGGKNGVNVNSYKNYIGTIYPASLVISDVAFLNSLSQEEFLNGIAELIKISILCDKDLFNYLKTNYQNIVKFQKENLIHIIKTGVELKNKFVEKDLNDASERKALNFGHTIGHAIETASNFSISHGFAVSIGMAYEIQLTSKLGITPNNIVEETLEVLKLYNLPYQLENNLLNKAIESIAFDKKKEQNKITMPIIKEIGKSNLEKVNIESFNLLK
ncbi:MAG: 3-dehydroquinate synthase [Sphingobacteriia bacterium]|nr:3-dehydroquinate synthase [Sphingobacteriia bacterium]